MGDFRYLVHGPVDYMKSELAKVTREIKRRHELIDENERGMSHNLEMLRTLQGYERAFTVAISAMEAYVSQRDVVKPLFLPKVIEGNDGAA